MLWNKPIQNSVASNHKHLFSCLWVGWAWLQAVSEPWVCPTCLVLGLRLEGRGYPGLVLYMVNHQNESHVILHTIYSASVCLHFSGQSTSMAKASNTGANIHALLTVEGSEMNIC